MDNKALLIDHQLIDRALKGEELAYKQLFDMYNKKLFLICMRYSSSREEAEDMLQESFITIFKELHQFDASRGSFIGWASKISVNTNLQYIRKKKLQYTSLDQNDETFKKIENDADFIAGMEMKEMVSYLQKMPQGYRTVFNLYVLEGYDHKEIAEMLGISESTSRTQLMKSRSVAKNILINELEITR